MNGLDQDTSELAVSLLGENYGLVTSQTIEYLTVLIRISLRPIRNSLCDGLLLSPTEERAQKPLSEMESIATGLVSVIPGEKISSNSIA